MLTEKKHPELETLDLTTPDVGNVTPVEFQMAEYRPYVDDKDPYEVLGGEG